MLPGPVFNIELLTTSRRRRYFLLRALYGGLLLYVIWQTYATHFWWRGYGYGPGGAITTRRLADFAQSMFASFVVLQGFALGVLTPALTSGVIADEKQRKTLHDLLASSLTSGEIVLGKLAARCLHLGVYLAIGLPIISLLSLFGGVDPADVALAYGITLTSTFLLAGLSVFISTQARRPRDALVAVFVIAVAWLGFPPAIVALLHEELPALEPPVRTVFEWIDPFAWMFEPRPTGPDRGSIGWMVVLEVVYGIAFLALAVWRLRPTFRRQEEQGGRRRGWRARFAQFRLFPRPPCGDDPMLWKECHVARARGLLRGLIVVVAVVGGGLLAVGTALQVLPALDELLTYGYTSDWQNARHRLEFNMFLRSVGVALYVLWGLCLAAASASGIGSERDRDTWLSLLATPLEDDEILRAKLLGPFWTLKALPLLLVTLWGVGVLAGALHPVGFLAGVVELAVFGAFIVAFGTFVSLTVKSTGKAMALAVGVLVFLNGGFLFCCVPLMRDVGTPAFIFPVTPALVGVSLVGYPDFAELIRGERAHYDHTITGRVETDLALACVLGVLVYGGATYALLQGALAAFGRAVGRPSREADLRANLEGYWKARGVMKPDGSELDEV